MGGGRTKYCKAREATASQQMTARHRLERLEKLVIDRMSAMTPQQRVAALEALSSLLV